VKQQTWIGIMFVFIFLLCHHYLAAEGSGH